MAKNGAAKTTKGRERSEQKRARAKERFLVALERVGTVTSAAKSAGIGRTTAYEWREDDEKFADAWDHAMEAKADELEESMFTRAVGGDTRAAEFMLKAMRPEKYRERHDVRADVRAGVVQVPERYATEEDWGDVDWSRGEDS